MSFISNLVGGLTSGPQVGATFTGAVPGQAAGSTGPGGLAGAAAAGVGAAGAPLAGNQLNLAAGGVSNLGPAAQLGPPPGGGAILITNPSMGSTYKPFANADVVTLQQDTVTKGLWSNDKGSLVSFFTGSTLTATQKKYYYEIFQSASTAQGSQPQFAVSYGNAVGSGSTVIGGGSNNDTATRAVYSQYKQLLLEPGDDRFSFNGVDSDQIYVININRARYRGGLDAGNIEINIAHLSGSEFVGGGGSANDYTGSNVGLAGNGQVLRIIDDSKLASTGTAGQAGIRYNLISGSIDNGAFNSSNPHYYGLLYPTLGIAVLDGTKLNLSASFASVTGSGIEGDNSFKLLTAISGAAVINSTYGFQARNEEKIKSDFYFVRVRNDEFNYSNNPSYVTGSEGQFKQASFVNNSISYITSIGLYNNNRELLAVAKLSKPLLKSFTSEALIKVKLEF